MSKSLTAHAIAAQLIHPIPAEVMESVDSTNTEAKRRVWAGLSTPLLLLAKRQTAGRGRMGRTFCSPEGAGLYMSLILFPDCPIAEVLPITSAAAVAVALAIEETTGLSPQIKWVNDVYLHGKKLSGILTEGMIPPEGQSAVIVGIGINCTPAALPPEVASIATSLADEGGKVDQNLLAARVCDRLLDLYDTLSAQTWLAPYRERSLLDGKRVVWRSAGDLSGKPLGEGLVIGIGDNGELMLDTPEGMIALTGGEVSVRMIE
ncbi:MAG: biotin--[Oscillospiraceae bacterium]|nr:biotin--[acetyl-CoA-carboxylase] ligase [Oscillospiraceae bacterium]